MATHLEYMRAAMARAQFEQTESGASWFTYIVGFNGLWAMGATRDAPSIELWETLDGWLDCQMKIGNCKPPVITEMVLGSPPKLVEPANWQDTVPCTRHEFVRKLKGFGYAGSYGANHSHLVRTSAVLVGGAQTITVPNTDLGAEVLAR